jgi:thiamine biosynthesis lipoprotein
MTATTAVWEFEAIGTRWHIALYGRARWPDELRSSITALIKEFDQNYSRFRPDSLVSRMARRAGRYRLPADAQPLFDLYRQLYAVTGGKVTPLIGQTLEQAGYGASYRLEPGALTTPPAWDEVLDYRFPYLTLRQPALLDVGAAGKGYLVDLVAGLLTSAAAAEVDGLDDGFDGFVIDAGGDLRHQASRKTDDFELLAVGLEKPDALDEVIGVARLHNQSLCGSAGNRRIWADGRFHHIIDPQSLASPRHLQAVWACADSTLLADGLTTALYFCPPERLLEHFSFSYAMLDGQGMLTASNDFPAEFYSL